MKRVELENHSLKDCTERTITCRWCNRELIHRNMKQHNSVCPKLEILCEVCKKSKLPRNEIKLHQDPENGDCPRRKRCCKFRRVGCEFTAPQEQMPGHLKNNQQEHMNLLLDDNINMRTELEFTKKKMEKYESMELGEKGASALHFDNPEEIVKMVVKNLKQNGIVMENHEIDSFKSLDINSDNGGAGARKKVMNINQNGSLKEVDVKKVTSSKSSEIRELKTMVQNNSQKIKSVKETQAILLKKNEIFHDALDVLNTEMDNAGQRTVNILKEVEKVKTSVEETTKNLKAVDQAMAVKNVVITEQFLQIKSLENTSYNGILVWKIPNISQNRRDAISGKQTSIYSPYFFTSRYGYRVCCRIYLNGDGMGKGTHISIFFVIMKGANDALLQWPFRNKVNFVLLDQNNREHIIDGFRPDETSSSFRRPTSDMNIASGCPLFISMSELEASPNAYIKDDTMFIKVIVDMSDVQGQHSLIKKTFKT
ncbi:TNF receptor-associated factor 2-like [Antedon mediterranea]|uniref:TNF receptor-associated factor 2-like n=1 Tax=Antedon mediterranea TaxID=105859 RepID=UPI003AF71E66